ncbi:MAG: type I-C CRISPR-associated protein Cas5c [Actinobacteria bacterium]|nr:type I-C CRISPR-associated protein Cas5c [Actinomycetota bacterium]
MTARNPNPAAPVSVKVWGDFACFTRPEFGVERVSYPAMTPTAAVGVLDAIFWKPQFRWRVVAIDVLKPVRWMQLRRNEIQSRQTVKIAKGWADGDDQGLDIASDRTQRSTLLLTDVAYVIHAQVEVQPGIADGPAKYRDQFRRRVNRGQCHERPYLGCREFVANFGPSDGDKPVAWTEDLGLMVHSVYAGSSDPAERADVEPIFFSARIADGHLTIPTLPEGRR